MKQNLGERLRAERTKRKISRIVAAQQIGISLQYIALIEQGQFPAEKTAEKIERWIASK